MLRINPFAPAILASLLASLAVAATVASSPPARAADDCIAKPNAAAPPGNHWYYRVDRTTRRACWFLGAQGTKVRRAATAKPPASARPAAPDAATPSAGPPAVPASAESAAGPDAAFTLRWPDQVAASDATEHAPASDNYAAEPWRVPDTIAARSVPTITLRKDAEPAAAEPVPAAIEGANMLPAAALAGVALVLAVVGGVLLRLAARSPDRRELRALGGEAGHTGCRADADLDIARSAMRPANDIAAATLQPDMAVTAPEPIRTADDIEHSLRQLLQDWQRLAA